MEDDRGKDGHVYRKHWHMYHYTGTSKLPPSCLHLLLSVGLASCISISLARRGQWQHHHKLLRMWLNHHSLDPVTPGRRALVENPFGRSVVEYMQFQPNG
ncbi:hypothetical protein N657DRAFT_391358 [Parathielavia appendiculata]|uniref:Uncharacterized protein n=1 Tax=Parathielavia appendiculata TaxID=2587402 RepID=A0AAN6Z506_9PEZI|nr:hypothetical protein N657DRAFT_391358 [Parathielavia appendiculata]